MTNETQNLSYGRLVTRFTQLGPYLRKDKTNEETYFFDCLSVCVNATKSPETREFWGWWLELNTSEKGFHYDYHFGKFDIEGNWVSESIPNENNKEVKATLKDFYQKLGEFVKEDLSLKLTPAKELKNPKL